MSDVLGLCEGGGPMVAPWAGEGLHLMLEAWLVPASAASAEGGPCSELMS